MRLRTKMGLKMLNARIWLLRKRATWNQYPVISQYIFDIVGESDAKAKAKVDKMFDSLRMN